MYTKNQFTTLNDLYDYYNAELFGSKLPDCIVNLSRQARCKGFHLSNGWLHRLEGVDDNDNIPCGDGDNKVCEISLNPDQMYRPAAEWHSTFVHEMCHQWQLYYGTESRNGYHNSEWADKMEEVGLMPSSTGEADGKRVGQHMSHYIIVGGAFSMAFDAIPVREGKKLILPFLPAPSLREATKKTISKVKYSCDCGRNVWGKEGLSGVWCKECDSEFLAQIKEEI